MKEASPGLIRAVDKDLQYLLRDWPGGDVSDDEVRRSSTVLRRLLTYRDLLKVWTTVVGRKPFVVPSSHFFGFDAASLPKVELASAAEVQTPGMWVGGVVVFKGKREDERPYKSRTDENCSLKDFIHKPALIVSGVPVARNDLVQFVANKRGGAHYDESLQKPNEIAIGVLEQFELAGRPGLIYEMLGVGQALAAAKSSKELLDAIRSAG